MVKAGQPGQERRGREKGGEGGSVAERNPRTSHMSSAGGSRLGVGVTLRAKEESRPACHSYASRKVKLFGSPSVPKLKRAKPKLAVHLGGVGVLKKIRI
jgi:hypothetical protein